MYFIFNLAMICIYYYYKYMYIWIFKDEFSLGVEDLL